MQQIRSLLSQLECLSIYTRTGRGKVRACAQRALCMRVRDKHVDDVAIYVR